MPRIRDAMIQGGTARREIETSMPVDGRDVLRTRENLRMPRITAARRHGDERARSTTSSELCHARWPASSDRGRFRSEVCALTATDHHCECVGCGPEMA